MTEVDPQSLEGRYFQWLYGMIGAVTDRNESHSHWLLAEQMYNTIFEWYVPNDDNRASDGTMLRDDFCDIVGSGEDSKILFEPCNVLEMLLALAKRIDFETAGDTVDDAGIGLWFWRMVGNAGLAGYTDAVYCENPNAAEEVAERLNVILQRRYDRNGRGGGLFPLHAPRLDQRKVELWYQMSAYLLENCDIAD